MRRLEIGVTAVAILVVTAACDRGAPPAEPASETPGSMSEMPAASGADEPMHVAHGTINRLDRERGTANISHDAVASANWPAMTMDFELADPTAAESVKEGQRVMFHFTTKPDGRAVVSKIELTQ